MKKTKQEEILSETVLLVNLFLQTNESDTELSRRTGISSSTVGRRLTNKEVILKAFPKNGETVYDIIKKKRKYNLQRGKIIGNQSSMLNNIESNGKTPKLRLDVIYQDYKKQMKFLSHLALTFRLKLPLLSELFGIPEKILLEELIELNKTSYESLLYLFYQDKTDQELAKLRIIEYYRSLLDAIVKKDASELNDLIREIGDSKVVAFKDKHKSGDVKSDEDIMNLLMYQLKYAISNKGLAEKFKFDRCTYMVRVRKLIEDNLELYERYNELTDYHKERSLSPWK